MSKLNINFNDKNFAIDNSALSSPRADFVAYLGTIAGEGAKITVDGVVYNVNPTKLNGAVASLENVLNNLNASGGDTPTDAPVPGLYQTGAIALYEEQGAEVIEGMMIAYWDDLITDGVVHVEYGAVYSNNASSDTLVGDLVLPNSVTNISDEAFKSCAKLTGIVIPNSVTSIGSYAFRSCTGLTSITIPDSVTSIGSGAFSSCTSLTSITIPDSVTSIEDKTFFTCSNLTSITISNSVTSIGKYAFDWCKNLIEITYNGTIDQWNAVTKGVYWNRYVPTDYVQCTDGRSELSRTED